MLVLLYMIIDCGSFNVRYVGKVKTCVRNEKKLDNHQAFERRLIGNICLFTMEADWWNELLFPVCHWQSH